MTFFLFKKKGSVVGDTRLRLRPENVEMNLCLKYNLRNKYLRHFDMNQLKTPPNEYLAPNSLNKDYNDDDSDVQSMVTESDEEGSEIGFTDKSDEENNL